jgi:[ribosomal protein S5]-alanine N-acetyltransferase
MEHARRSEPLLPTARLLLRALRVDDARAVADGAGDKRVARFLLQVPSPYPLALARRWVQGRIAWWRDGRGITMAIARRGVPEQLIGSASLRVNASNRRAELGYWLAHEAWGQGYATEACRAMIDLGFRDLGLARIFAQVLTGNDPSCHVLTKLGFRREGELRAHLKKAGKLRDVIVFGLLRDEWS